MVESSTLAFSTESKKTTEVNSATAGEPKLPSKKQVERDAKKLKNKTKQAVTVLCKAENLPYEKWVTKESTRQILVTHFGNGDESD